MKHRGLGGLVVLLVILTGCPPPCGGEGQACCADAECGAGLACASASMTCEEVAPMFPADYRDQFTMVRDCRRSIEHDLVYVRVWANDTAAAPYLSRTGTFPEGSLLVKEEFGSDDTCTDQTDLVGWATMQRETGYAPEAGDWHWQNVAFDRTVALDGPIFECFSCHEECGVPPEGFDWTCAVP